ncbi:peptide-methionine (S)-S-oxide reductase MsrA [Propionivibrio sp.]|uniref:peptide-methionine (S)-S-oxide reductase MsrA n=1 Tax=Propionivibrio sp. TaxID=2212460 RepID=UPI002610BA3C|nr:peptide-methionine (S)-S-oxide reductase MsrA [Propionivibrio sp.]
MSKNSKELTTLGGGCFWCLEAAFEQVIGVVTVVSGYAGGHTENPDYRTICEGSSGHAEVVQVVFDPSEISYRELLEIFFVIHDPTSLNRQGNDLGTQYRSVIFYHSPVQSAIAEALIAELNAQGLWPGPIVTQLLPVPRFFPAEDYHQHYFAMNPDQPYCQFVVSPKLGKLRKKFANRIKPVC